MTAASAFNILNQLTMTTCIIINIIVQWPLIYYMHFIRLVNQEGEDI